MTQGQTNRSRNRRGIVLLAVLVIVVVLTLAAYQFSELMLAEYRAADGYTRTVQARAMADSGVHFAAVALSNPDAMSSLLSNNPYDNPTAFRGVIVQSSDVPRFQGRFSVISPNDPDDATASGPYRFGVTDETGKINLNALLKIDSSGRVAHDMLMLLPNMTEEIANAILDWIDSDEDERAGGAENEVYQTLSPSYRCKNGPLDSLEELLLVRGVTPLLLLGNDRNRNGVLDADEQDGSGVLDRGWSAYLTIYSRELNLDAEGQPRININDSDLNGLSQKLNTALGPDLANFIIAYRMYGPAQQAGTSDGGGVTMAIVVRVTPSVSGGATGRITADLSTSSQRSARTTIASLYELINATVSIPSGNTATSGAAGGGQSTQQDTITLPSPLNDPGMLRELLPLLLDKVTTVTDQELPARINVNTAPRAVLMTLPGLSESDAQTIIDNRPSPADTDAPDPIFETPAWLITEANLPAQTLRSLERYITARSQVYRVQALGHFDSGGTTAQIEAVIDTNAGRPRIIYWRDLTELGKGYNIQTGQ